MTTLENPSLRRHLARAAAIFVAVFCVATAHGVILLNTADPQANTTEPAGALAGSGWQFEGTWGSFLGTSIAPHFFLSAAHIGRAGSVFNFNGATYTIDRSFAVPGTDLLIWRVVETLPTFALFYLKHDEVGKPLVVIGRGTERGSDVLLNGELRGWNWGGDTHVQRWGENVVSDVFENGAPNDKLIYATFDRPGLANEAQLSSGDSGGAVFLNDGGTWKLAGINYAVDGPFYTNANGTGEFNAALFDSRGFYFKNGSSYVQIADANPVPTGLYATAVSSQIPAIYSIIDPEGDPDGDGISNLLEYALMLDPLVPDAAGEPTVSRDADTLTLTYTQRLSATDLVYSVEKSSDLISWSAANAQEDISPESNGARVVKANVPIAGADRLFLRLRVTRP